MEYQIENFIINDNLVLAFKEIPSEQTKRNILDTLIQVEKGCDGAEQKTVFISDIVTKDHKVIIHIEIGMNPSRRTNQTFPII